MLRRLPRPTLRLRLTLLNGVLLVGVGALLLTLAFLLVSDALRPAEQLNPQSQVLLTDGRTMPVSTSFQTRWRPPDIRSFIRS